MGKIIDRVSIKYAVSCIYCAIFHISGTVIHLTSGLWFYIIFVELNDIFRQSVVYLWIFPFAIGSYMR